VSTDRLVQRFDDDDHAPPWTSSHLHATCGPVINVADIATATAEG
jgi:hypothetical protein